MKRINRYETFEELNAVRNLLAEEGEEMLAVKLVEDDTYALAENAYSDRLDMSGLGEEATVMRTKDIFATENTAVALDRFIIGMMALNESIAQEKILNIVKRRLQKNDIPASKDESGRGNDIVVEGSKIFGVTKDQAHDMDLIFFFIPVTNDYSMLRNLRIPSEKFEGKVSSTPEERATALDEYVELDVKQFCNNIEEKVADKLGKELEDYAVSEELDEKVQERADYLTSEEFINERQPR